MSGSWEDRAFREFPALLRGDELLVVNNTRVIPARLLGRRAGVRSGPRASAGQSPPRIPAIADRGIASEAAEPMTRGKLSCARAARSASAKKFSSAKPASSKPKSNGAANSVCAVCGLHSSGDLTQTIERLGHVPLPPYIRRSDDPADRERYQTIFASRSGAVAAPTAGLHFTPAILEQLRARKIEIAEITLEVGLGTFEPIRTEQLEEHRIHKEAYEIPEATAQSIIRAKQERRPILAIGTTAVRALEDAAEKSIAISAAGSAQADTTLLNPGRAEAEIFLYPGKPFRVVDQLLTNFHLPRSSLLAMVAAFAGRENILRAYAHSVDAGYRFYSYGDCMLIR